MLTGLAVERDSRRSYRVGRFRVQLVREASVVSDVRIIRTPADAAALARAMLDDLDREAFVVILLNTRHAVLGVNLVSLGGLNLTPVHAREVFKPAIIAGAVAVILAHNHPSGDATPSQEDVLITEQPAAAGRVFGIEVCDHIIIGNGTGQYTSLRGRGWQG